MPFLRCCCNANVAQQLAAAPSSQPQEDNKSSHQQQTSSSSSNNGNHHKQNHIRHQKGGAVHQRRRSGGSGSHKNNLKNNHNSKSWKNHQSSVSSLVILEEDSTNSNSMNLSCHDNDHQKQEEYRPSTPSSTHSMALTEETMAMTPPHGSPNSLTTTETEHDYASVSSKSLPWHDDNDENDGLNEATELQTMQNKNEEPDKQQDQKDPKSAEQELSGDLSSPATQPSSPKENPEEHDTFLVSEEAKDDFASIEKQSTQTTEEADEQEAKTAEECIHRQAHEPMNLDTTEAQSTNKTAKWMRRYRGNNEEESEERIQLRQQIKEALAATLSQEEMEFLFETVDKNGDGTLSLTEVEKAMFQRVAPQFDLKPAIVFRAFHKADLDGNGKIDKDEFFVFVRMLAYFDNMRFVFSKLDSDGDRQLSQQEFMEAADVLDIEDPERVFEEMDGNILGYIVFDDFCAWMAKHRTG